MFRRLRWYWAKRRLACPILLYRPRHVKVRHPTCRIRVEDLPPPNAEGYERLAAFWNDYASWFVPRYDRFVVSAANYYGQPIRTVLDLACGTGLLTRRLARRVDSVVGLDASAAMLREARSRTRAANVRYLQGDFRDFSLGETFDAAVCASDSLNYLETPEELEKVFSCVRRHLRPGGLFLFDALNARACRIISRNSVVAYVAGERFEIYLFYNPKTRVGDCRAVFKKMVEENGIKVLKPLVERHRRISIEPEDVRRAAGEAKLEVVEQFSGKLWLRQFYVLRGPV
ncbi:MAG: methyltransferase domain-containing protein [Planctomycetes bacterium]|nr:methyltransferase domain-containing protein [Planctomycetota bacterium]